MRNNESFNKNEILEMININTSESLMVIADYIVLYKLNYEESHSLIFEICQQLNAQIKVNNLLSELKINKK